MIEGKPMSFCKECNFRWHHQARRWATFCGEVQSPTLCATWTLLGIAILLWQPQVTIQIVCMYLCIYVYEYACVL